MQRRGNSTNDLEEGEGLPTGDAGACWCHVAGGRHARQHGVRCGSGCSTRGRLEHRRLWAIILILAIAGTGTKGATRAWATEARKAAQEEHVEEPPPRVIETPPGGRRSPFADSPREMWAVRVSEGPVVDGSLGDEVWRLAADGGPLVEYSPHVGAEPTYRTEVRVLYDAEALYIGILCHDDEPEKILAVEMAHEGRITADDYVMIVLDTFHDRRNGYEFLVNPNGARGEALITNNVSVNESWDGIWTARARITEEGWSAELAVPFKTLSFDPQKETWGFNMLRTVRRLSEHHRWSAARPEINTYNVAEAGILAGLKDLEQGLDLDFTPYFLSAYHHQHESSDHDSTFEGGGDLRYRITPNLSASISYNTDFAETEVDSRQVNLTRFPLFFPEKRSFFLEDSGVFRFGGLGSSLLPFFSRRIGLSDEGDVVPILVAGKMTGRVGDYNLGVIDALVDSHGDLDSKNVFVGRVARNILDQSSLGMIATLGDPNSNDDNLTVGGDFGYRTSKLFGDHILEGNAFVMESLTEGREGNRNKSFGANLSYPNDEYFASAGFYQVDEEFKPALGFAPRTGVRVYSHTLSFRPRPQSIASIRQLFFTYSGASYTDLGDRLDTAVHSLTPLYVLFESADAVYLNLNAQFDSPDEDFEISDGVVIAAADYWWNYLSTGFDMASKRPVEAEFNYSYGEFYDGHRSSYSAQVDLKPIRHLVFRLAYSIHQVRLPQGDFDTELASVRMQVSFTPNLIWYNLLQYDNVSDTLGFQSRWVWEVHPGSKVYLVLQQLIDRGDQGHLTWLETDLTLKVAVTFRF